MRQNDQKGEEENNEKCMGWCKSKERRRCLYFEDTFNVQIEMSEETGNSCEHSDKKDNNKELRIC